MEEGNCAEEVARGSIARRTLNPPTIKMPQRYLWSMYVYVITGNCLSQGFVMAMNSGVVRLSYSTKADVRAFREVGELFDNTSKATHGGRRDQSNYNGCQAL
jgi:hypothetical protein